MLTRLLNAALWIDTAFSRTADPVVAEYRVLQRHFILSGTATIVALLPAMLLAGLLDGAGERVRPILAEAGMALLLLALAGCIWFAWATYALWRWTKD